MKVITSRVSGINMPSLIHYGPESNMPGNAKDYSNAGIVLPSPAGRMGSRRLQCAALLCGTSRFFAAHPASLRHTPLLYGQPASLFQPLPTNVQCLDVVHLSKANMKAVAKCQALRSHDYALRLRPYIGFSLLSKPSIPTKSQVNTLMSRLFPKLQHGARWSS